jgi:hypothetical protein
MTMTLIETKTLGTAAASIEFTSIPQDGTDLVLVVSGRSTSASIVVAVDCLINGSSSDMTGRYLEGTGSTTGSSTDLGRLMALANGSGSTANSFGNSVCYIPNYAITTTAKSWSVDASTENNATANINLISANLWNPTTKAAITSIRLDIRTGNFAVGSTASLYKITKGSDGIVTTS